MSLTPAARVALNRLCARMSGVVGQKNVTMSEAILIAERVVIRHEREVDDVARELGIGQSVT